MKNDLLENCLQKKSLLLCFVILIFISSKGTVVEKSQWNPNHLCNKIASFLVLFYVFTFFPRNAFNRVSRCWTCHVKWVTLNGLNWRCLTNMWWTWKLWIVEFAFGVWFCKDCKKQLIDIDQNLGQQEKRWNGCNTWERNDNHKMFLLWG